MYDSATKYMLIMVTHSWYLTHVCMYMYIILVWPTSWTPAVCEWVCPKTCRHIARHMMNGWLWNVACMSGTMMPTMRQILVVTQWVSDPIKFKNRLFNCVWVCPKTCLHIARHMMNGWLWNFPCMSGTMMPTVCQILVVTQLHLKNV